MTNWIDQFKDEIEAKKSAQAIKDEMKLRKDRIIKTKVPIFWKELLTNSDSQCTEVNDKLPEEYHCYKQMIGANSFKVETRSARPIRLSVELSSDGQYILTEMLGSSGKSSLLTFDIDDKDRLVLASNNGRRYFTAEDLINTMFESMMRPSITI